MRVIPLSIRVIAVVLFAAATALAGEFENGQAAYDRGDFATSKRLWLPVARQGDARAQTGLCIMYFLGQGVQLNISAALEWCSRAADQGSAVAQYELGQIYQHPWLPELQDYPEALRWYRKAADQGYANAQDEIGGMYEFGLGVPRDYAAAEKWFEKAGDLLSIAKMYDNVAKNPYMAAKWYNRLAEQGSKYAKFRLGQMYRDGAGVQQDNTSACMWFNLAAASGYLYAAKAREELVRKMSRDQIVKSQRLAGEWKLANESIQYRRP